MKMKRILSCFLALVMVMSYLPLNPIASYADGDVPIDADHFPNEAFRNYVKRFDTTPDNKLNQTELNSATNISISSMGISDLRGIEHFKNLKVLKCNGNNLTSLNLGDNTNLDTLWCGENQLKSLDVSHNLNLKQLWCSRNKLESLKLGNNTNLTDLSCRGNNLSSLDVSHNPNLTNLGCYNNHLTNLDVSNNKNLTKLYCYDNKLKSLDVSNNTNLDTLWCGENQLKSLDVSHNLNLKQLWCSRNKLESLKLGNNTNLTDLSCRGNNLTELDVSHNPNLTNLGCYNNKLTSLDVSNNKRLRDINCSNQQYNITVRRDTRKFEYSKFPRGFDKAKVTLQAGATPGADALIVNSDTPSEVTYKYKVGNKEMDVKLNVTYIDPFTVTFKDGDKTSATVKVENGKAIERDALTGESMPANPTKDGYTFKEWNTKENGKGETFTGESVVNGNMTVYAIYTKNPKPQPKTPDSKTQHDKHIDTIPQTGESASFAGVLAALGFSITGFAILRKKKMMKENK